MKSSFKYYVTFEGNKICLILYIIIVKQSTLEPRKLIIVLEVTSAIIENVDIQIFDVIVLVVGKCFATQTLLFIPPSVKLCVFGVAWFGHGGLFVSTCVYCMLLRSQINYAGLSQLRQRNFFENACACSKRMHVENDCRNSA